MTTELTRYNVAVAVAYQAIDEDLVRRSLLDAIALCSKVKLDNWFQMNQAARLIHIHIDNRLNAELKALLVGDIGYYSR